MKLLLTLTIVCWSGSAIFADPVVLCNDPDMVSVPYLVYRERELQEIYRRLETICRMHSNSHLVKARDEVLIALKQINQLKK